MANQRRTKTQIAADKIINGHLNKFGRVVQIETRKITRVLTGDLKKSINYNVKPDTVLNFYQNAYGKDVRPTKQTTGPTDALMITIKELLPNQIEVIKKDLTESILYPFRGGKTK